MQIANGQQSKRCIVNSQNYASQMWHLRRVQYGSSTPSNFTIFAFIECSPLLTEWRDNCLLCHTIQQHGQRQSLDKINASVKKEVILPKDYNSTITQLQNFIGAIKIFVGHDSIAAVAMRCLMSQFTYYKSNSCNEIESSEWFAARILFAINRKF